MTVIENLVEQIHELSKDGLVEVGVLTMVFRADGYSDEEISSAYDKVVLDPTWDVRVEQGRYFFCPA